MKKFLVLMLTGIMVLVFSGIVSATEYVYRPLYALGSDPYATNNPDKDNYDLADLDHYRAYSWGIDLHEKYENQNAINLNTETITSVSLFFENIRNWDNNSNVLFVDLLSGAPKGVVEYGNGTSWPNNIQDANYFNAAGDTFLFKLEGLTTVGRNIDVILDDNGYHPADAISNGATLTIPANSLSNLNTYALDSYLSGGIFGLGFDPDCHFWNDGITLTITTTTSGDVVPEPATLMLFGIGLLGFAGRMRKKMKQA